MNPMNAGFQIATNNVAQVRRRLKGPANEKQRKALESLLMRELAKLFLSLDVVLANGPSPYVRCYAEN